VILPGSAYAEPLADVVRTVDGSHAEAGDPREVAELDPSPRADPDPAPVHSIGEHVPGQLLAKRLALRPPGGNASFARRYRRPGRAAAVPETLESEIS